MTSSIYKEHRTLNCNGQLLSVCQPIVMGILNTTPDSFFDGGKHNSLIAALKQAEHILKDGAGIIDLGAYSSRPNAPKVSEEEEWQRLYPVLKEIRKSFPEAVLSIDTFRSEIARKSIEEGGGIINDVSGGSMEPEIFNVAAYYQVPYILMHMRGTPADMQNQTQYKNVTNDIILYFAEKVNTLRKLGLNDIILDPGFGFAKTTEQNFQLLSELSAFQLFELPLLAGLSRKSMIYKTLEIDAQYALNGTTALNMAALINGAKILRVHDVKKAAETVRLYQALYPSNLCLHSN